MGHLTTSFELLFSKTQKNVALFAQIDHELQLEKDFIAQNGLCISSLMMLSGTTGATLNALSNLSYGLGLKLVPLREEMRAHYPKGRGRRRNARAYLIAEQLARFYVRRLGKRPTWGVRTTINHPPILPRLSRCLQFLK